MKSLLAPRTGDFFLCLKGNRPQGTVKGAEYLYVAGSLKRFTKRNVTVLSNGDELLSRDGAFKQKQFCPFCAERVCDLDNGTRTDHDGVECAAEWDSYVKHYCRTCHGDTKNGVCPKCDKD